MSETVSTENREAKSETRTGGAMNIEKLIERWLGNAIHLFLSLLALLTFVAAAVTAWDTVVRDFPKLWQPVNEYSVLQEILQTILLIGIAAELGLLLLFHRTTAAVEVIIFVIARKMVSPDITVLELLLGTVAIIALVVMRFYYLPGKAK
ncbi:MAG: hypothetical protein U0Z53_08700 [Blastocatellia bacterium]